MGHNAIEILDTLGESVRHCAAIGLRVSLFWHQRQAHNGIGWPTGGPSGLESAICEVNKWILCPSYLTW
jgi:hypothetical protein